MVDEAAARRHLADRPALPDELKAALTGSVDWDAFAAALDAAEAMEAARHHQNCARAKIARRSTDQSINIL